MSFFLHLFRSNGFIFGSVMLLTAMALAGLIASLAFRLRRGNTVGRGLAPRLTEAAVVGPARMSELTRGDRSLLAQAVAAGVAQLPHGLVEARHAVACVVEGVRAPQERALRWLGALALLAPLLGLLGTVLGVLLACMTMGQGDGAEVRLINGLGHALSVVLEGLFLGIIAVAAYVLFKNRLHCLMLTTGVTADELVTLAHNQGRA